jgi:hypothetical protein
MPPGSPTQPKDTAAYENPALANASANMFATQDVDPKRTARINALAERTQLQPQVFNSLTDKQLKVWEDGDTLKAIKENGQHMINAMANDPEKAAIFRDSLVELARTEEAIRLIKKDRADKHRFDSQSTWDRNFATPMAAAYHSMRAGANLSEADRAAAQEHAFNAMDVIFHSDPEDSKALINVTLGVLPGEDAKEVAGRKKRERRNILGTYPGLDASNTPDAQLNRYRMLLEKGDTEGMLAMREFNRSNMATDVKDFIDATKDREALPQDVELNKAMSGSTGDLLKHLVSNPGAAVRVMSAAAVTTVPTLAAGLINPAAAFMASVYTEQVSFLEGALQSRGIDLSDSENIMKALQNRPLMQEVRGEGIRKGLGVGIIDVLSMGAAGKLLAPKSLGGKMLTPWQRVGINTVPQFFVQGALEGLGEGVGSVFATGDFQMNEVLLEAVAGGGMAQMDVMVYGGKNIFNTVKEYNANKLHAAHAQAWLAEGENAIKNIKNVPAAMEHAQEVAEVVAAKMKENGQNTVFMDAEKLLEFHQDSDDDVLATIGLDATEVEEAARAGGLVEMTPEVYARHILGVEGFAALQKHTKDDANGFTPAFAEEFEAVGEDVVEEEIKRTRDKIFEATGQDPDFLVTAKAQFDQIQETVKLARLAMGGVTEAQAAFDGLIWATRDTTRAIRVSKETGTQVTPFEIWEKNNAQFEGPGSTPAQYQRRGDPAFVPVDPLEQDTAWRTLPVEVMVVNEDGTRTPQVVEAGAQLDAIRERRETALEILRDGCLG